MNDAELARVVNQHRDVAFDRHVPVTVGLAQFAVAVSEFHLKAAELTDHAESLA